MTRSSQPVRTHISEFDDNFERTLRRKRKVPEPNPPSSSSESEFEEKEEAEKDMEVDNRTKNFQPRDWTMPRLYVSNTPQQPEERQKNLN
ncbi:hypothetical protein ACFX2C_013555 [Malus domestica]